MVIISETVKVTTVTCETEVINKVTNIDCSEAGTKMVEEEKKQGSDRNQVGFTHTLPKSKMFLITFSANFITNELLSFPVGL